MTDYVPSEAEILEAERQRLAHELHDGLSQWLVVARWQVLHLIELVKNGQSISEDALQWVLQPLEQGIVELRRSILALHPPDLEFGLVPAIERLVASLPLETTLTLDPDAARLSAEQGLAIYRTIQEALGNSLKHGHAKHAHVRLGKVGDQWALEIEDNGNGFDVDQRRHESLGLRTMEARAARIGGVMSVTSQPSCGTRVRVEFAE